MWGKQAARFGSKDEDFAVARRQLRPAKRK
jgi:hypothetical protein